MWFIEFSLDIKFYILNPYRRLANYFRLVYNGLSKVSGTRGLLKKEKMPLALSENKLLVFLREAREELKKAVWPSRKQLLQHTLVVIGVSAIVAAILGAIDIFLSLGLKTII